MRGMIFTIFFSVLFLLFLSVAVFYERTATSHQTSIERVRAVDKLGFIRYDIARDIAVFFELNVSASRSTISLSNRLPSSLADAGGGLTSYKNFIEGQYANRTNANISLDISTLSVSPFLAFTNGLNYSYDSPAHSTIRLLGNANITNFTISMVIDSSASGSTLDYWDWTGSGPACSPTEFYFWTNITDSSASRLLINDTFGSADYSGCVPAAANYSYTFNFAAGSLAVSAGGVLGTPRSVSLTVSGVSAPLVLNATTNSTVPFRAYWPAALTVNNYTNPTLVIMEK